MNSNKGFIVTVITVLTLFTSVVYTACKKPEEVVDKECVGITCENNGVCINGECSCTGGYSGRYCEVKNNARYLGNWDVKQQIISSNNQSAIGKTTYYRMSISEDASGIVYLKISGFYGRPEISVIGRIGMKIGYIEGSGGTEELDIQAPPTNFVFKRYQTLAGTKTQLIKGEGFINELATVLSATFETVTPDSANGVIQETVSLSANYID